MGVEFGLAIRNFVGPGEIPDIDSIVAYAEHAETLGFESLWAWDHILLGVEPAFPILDSISVLTAIAMRTTRIKLGTGVLVLPLRNPVVAAKVLATLDRISKGRLIVGVAAGWYSREFDAVGVPYQQRGKLFEQNLEVILNLWAEKSVTMQIGDYNLRQAVQVPKPIQIPRPAVLIGGYVDKVLRRVARVGDGWLTYFYTPEGFTKSWDKIKQYTCEYGRDPEELEATNQLAIYVGKSRSDVEESMHNWLNTEWDMASWSESTVDHAIYGTAEECAAQIDAHIQAGVHRLVLIPYRYELEQVDRIANEVIPLLS